jgi:hypothetical protein
VSSNVGNKVPFLRTSRDFPMEAQPLSIEINKSYIDIANAVNNRTISIFPSSRSSGNGESWLLEANRRQQGFRQIYPFTSTANIAHGIDVPNISFISPSTRGVFTDGANWYGLIFASSVAIAGQITFYVSPTSIVFVSGAGAPSLTSGVIVVEWVSQV